MKDPWQVKADIHAVRRAAISLSRSWLDTEIDGSAITYRRSTA
jgi:hypothetical protein